MMVGSRMLAAVLLVLTGIVTTRTASTGEHPCDGVQKTYVDTVTGVVHNCWMVCSNPRRDFQRYCKVYCRDFYQCMEELKSESPARSKTTSVSGIVAEAVSEPLPTRDPPDLSAHSSIWWGFITTGIAFCTVVIVAFLSVVHYRRRKSVEKPPKSGADSVECGGLLSEAPGLVPIIQDEVNSSLLHGDETEETKLDQPTESDSGVESLEDKEKESMGDAPPDVNAENIRDADTAAIGTGANDHTVVSMTEGSHCQSGERREPTTVCQDTQSLNINKKKQIVNILCVNGRGNMLSYVDYESTAPEPIGEPSRTLSYTGYGANKLSKVITAESFVGDNARFSAPRALQRNQVLRADGCGDDVMDDVRRSSAYSSVESLHLGSISSGGDVYLGIQSRQPEVRVSEETRPKMI